MEKANKWRLTQRRYSSRRLLIVEATLLAAMAAIVLQVFISPSFAKDIVPVGLVFAAGCLAYAINDLNR